MESQETGFLGKQAALAEDPVFLSPLQSSNFKLSVLCRSFASNSLLEHLGPKSPFLSHSRDIPPPAPSSSVRCPNSVVLAQGVASF
jgi:hypothetical protein